MKLTVLYFAKLKSTRGLSSEEIETGCRTPGDLYAHLLARHDLQVPASQVKAAINDAFCDPETPFQEGDTVAFMPPMSGG